MFQTFIEVRPNNLNFKLFKQSFAQIMSQGYKSEIENIYDTFPRTLGLPVLMMMMNKA